MKLYHGTSFENACKILSEELWFPTLYATRAEFEFLKQNNLASYPMERWEKACGIHFTTRISEAKAYALQHDRPVILWWQCDDANQSGCYCFDSTSPIPTKYVKALIGVNDMIMAYGTLVNAIYMKNVGDYNILSPCGGLLHAKNPTQMIQFLESIIKDIKNNKL